jgi:hypothetical protein
MDSLILLAFLGLAVCFTSTGLFNALWQFRRSEEGEDVRWLPRMHATAGEALRDWRATFGALMARVGDGPGEGFRRWARRAMIGSLAMVGFLVVLFVIAAVR